MSKLRIGRVLVAVGALALAGLVACTEDTPCDEGQVLIRGYCQPAPADAAPPTTPDADLSADTAAASPFGKTCTTSAECVAPADFCAVQPGSPTGNCTATGCDVDPSVCPPTFTCFDLTPFGQALHLCIPPM
jgi:hypothetical protein